ncbi:hypothetical protein GC163_00655 [bacterium]|nr:hypothetical protein [bacterium]
MHDDIDLLAELPPLRDDEPSSLRQDILDELADHLSCAYRRELLLTTDDQTARSRVLDRFGNPVRIAYQLWFQAMWSRIMSQRIVLACSVLTAAASIAAVVFVGSMLQQQQRRAEEQQAMMVQALMSLTAKLQEQTAAQTNARNEAAPVRDLVPLKIKLVNIDDPSQPLAKASVTISPEPMRQGDASPSESTDAEGIADFAYVSIGRYRYTINLPWGETTTAKFTVHPTAEHVETIAVPSRAPEEGTLQITSAMPPELKQANIAVAAYLMLQPRKVGELDWQSTGGIWAVPGNFPVSTVAVRAVQFADGEIWTSPASGGVSGGMGGGGFGGVPAGGMGGGGGFFSIPAEALANQLSTASLGQFSMGAGGMATPTALPWSKTKELTLISGEYQVRWISYGAVDTSNMQESQRMGVCDSLMQSAAFSISGPQNLTIQPHQTTSWAMTAPKEVIKSILGLDESVAATGLEAGAMAPQDGPDPSKLRIQFTGPKEEHSLRVGGLTLLTESGRSQYPGTSWEWKGGIPHLNKELPIGRYVFSIALGDGQTGTTRISIRDSEQPLVTVPFPPALKTYPVEIRGPIDPTPNPNYRLRPVITVNRRPLTLDGTTWTFSGFQKLSIHTSPRSGLVEEIETHRSTRDHSRTTFTTEDSAEDRFLPLMNGEYDVLCDLIVMFPEPDNTGIMLSPPPHIFEQLTPLHQTMAVDAEHTTWDLKIPEEWWAKLHTRASMFAVLPKPGEGSKKSDAKPELPAP